MKDMYWLVLNCSRANSLINLKLMKQSKPTDKQWDWAGVHTLAGWLFDDQGSCCPARVWINVNNVSSLGTWTVSLHWLRVSVICVCMFTAAGRRGQQTFGLRADCLFHVSHLQSREGLIKSGSPSLADEFFIKTICSPCAPTKISYKSSINWGLMISMRWSFTAKSSLYTVRWSLSRAIVQTEKQWRNIHQRITKGSQTLHGDLDVQRSSLRLWATQGPLESENEICCLTSLYWNPHFYQNVEDQGQTQAHSGGYMSQRWAQSQWIFVSEAISDCMIPILV